MTFQNRRPNNYRHNNKHRRNPNGQARQPHYGDPSNEGQEYTVETVQEIALSRLMQEKKVPKAILDLQQQKEQMRPKMIAVRNRLTFGYSEPLNEEYLKLVKQDLDLTCQINALLLALVKAS